MTTEISINGSRDFQLPGFRLTATGIVSNGKPTFAEWEAVGEFLKRAEGAVQFWIGDWLNYGDGRPQWSDKYEQAIEAFGKEYRTLREYRAVSAEFKNGERSPNLFWLHYQSMLCQSPEIRRELLASAEPESLGDKPRLSVGQLKKEAKRLRRELNTPPLPDGQYRVIYADPPWEYADEREGTTAGGSAVAQYDCMPTECISWLHVDGRSIRDIAASDSVLFLWTTSPMLPDALRVIAAWGFKYRSQFIWDKKRQYIGNYNGVRHEHLLIAMQGSCTPVEDYFENSFQDSIVEIERTAHSKKPTEFYEIIESMYPIGPYLELFARNTHDGWNSWGNEVDENEAKELLKEQEAEQLLAVAN